MKLENNEIFPPVPNILSLKSIMVFIKHRVLAFISISDLLLHELLCTMERMKERSTLTTSGFHSHENLNSDVGFNTEKAIYKQYKPSLFCTKMICTAF
jgi:hypothetical protein